MPPNDEGTFRVELITDAAQQAAIEDVATQMKTTNARLDLLVGNLVKVAEALSELNPNKPRRARRDVTEVTTPAPSAEERPRGPRPDRREGHIGVDPLAERRIDMLEEGYADIDPVGLAGARGREARAADPPTRAPERPARPAEETAPTERLSHSGDRPAERPVSQDFRRVPLARPRQGYFGGRDLEESRRIPPFGSLTTQSILTMGSHWFSQFGYARQENPLTGEQEFLTQPVDENGRPTGPPVPLRQNQIGSDGRPTVPLVLRSGGLATAGRGVGALAGFGARAIPAGVAAMAVARTVQGAINTIGGSARHGMALGYEQSFTGEGPRNRLQGLWESAVESRFGFNPFLGFGEAREINQAVESAGYTGPDRSAIFNTLAAIQGDTRVEAKDSLPLLDQIYRYGGGTLEQFNAAMRAVPAAAQAARMNVSQFTQQLAQTATQLSRTQGMTTMQATTQVNAVAAATGLTPPQIGSLGQDQFMTIMGSLQAGQSLGAYLNDPQRLARQATQGPEQMFQLATGGRRLEELPTNTALQEHVRTMMWVQPDMFGGLTYEQLMQQANDPRREERAFAESDLRNITNEIQRIEVEGGTVDTFGGRRLANVQTQQALQRRIATDLRRSGVDEEEIEEFTRGGERRAWSREDVTAQITEATRLTQKVNEAARDDASQQTSIDIGLTPEARRLIQVMEMQNPTPDRKRNERTNERSGWVRPAETVMGWIS